MRRVLLCSNREAASLSGISTEITEIHCLHDIRIRNPCVSARKIEPYYSCSSIPVLLHKGSRVWWSQIGCKFGSPLGVVALCISQSWCVWCLVIRWDILFAMRKNSTRTPYSIETPDSGNQCIFQSHSIFIYPDSSDCGVIYAFRRSPNTSLMLAFLGRLQGFSWMAIEDTAVYPTQHRPASL